MLLTLRPCRTQEDYAAMQRVLVEARAASPHSGTVHPGDLDWWRYYLLRAYAWPEIAFVAETDGDLVGWVLFSPHLSAFDCFVRPAARTDPTCDLLLDWTIQRADGLARERGAATLSTWWVFDDDTAWQARLRARGFAPDPSYTLHLLAHDLAAIPSPSLPGGFRLADTRAAAPEARAAAHRAAFGSSHMTPDAYRTLQQAPLYRPALDVVALAPDGRVASVALGWYDEANRVGQFEPVGTDPAFQGRGLGQAVVGEGLRRLAALGAREVLVSVEDDNAAAQALYRAMGFRAVNTIRRYVRPVG